MGKETVIFISSHNIQVIHGSSDQDDIIRLNDFYKVPFEEGAIINGVITDENAISAVVKTIREEGYHQARLVIDSGRIIVKNLQVPFLSQKELQQVIRNELSDMDASYEDLIYDYSVLHSSFDDEENRGGEILACAIERKLLSSYLSIFEQNGIIISSVDISLNALHKLTQELPDLRGKTYILSLLDNNNVYSYLFENNEYTFSNRTRLFSQRGSQEFISEMNSNISSLIQFSKSKHSTYQIGTVYFCGLKEDERKPIFDSIQNGLSIKAEELPNSKMIYIEDCNKSSLFELHNYVVPLGCLLRK